MANNRRFAIIGGDMRQIRLANALCESGEHVNLYGFRSDTPYLKLQPAQTLDDALCGATIIVLPLPLSLEAGIINTPFSDDKVYINALLEKMTKNQILLGGKIDAQLKTLLDINNIYYVDYFLREELNVLNAIPTAEGGISIALNETATTLNGNKCLVTGFGRIGKVLCKMLDGMGAKVCACARSPEAFSWIDVYGYEKCNIAHLGDIINKYDIIFNTVPHIIITKEVLEKMSPDALVIDLASKPGGVDYYFG